MVKFIDLFCGIGGFHQAISMVIPDSLCILASDIDSKVRTTYELNYNIKPLGDIKDIDIIKIPKFDLLCAGFPCQTFSIAQWKDKKAFDDPRGTLFFEILKIIDVHKPKCILLENVANITKINKGEVLKTIVKSLEDRCYKVSNKFDFTKIGFNKSLCKIEDILDNDVSEEYYVDPSKYIILDNSLIKKTIEKWIKILWLYKRRIKKSRSERKY